MKYKKRTALYREQQQEMTSKRPETELMYRYHEKPSEQRPKEPQNGTRQSITALDSAHAVTQPLNMSYVLQILDDFIFMAIWRDCYLRKGKRLREGGRGRMIVVKWPLERFTWSIKSYHHPQPRDISHQMICHKSNFLSFFLSLCRRGRKGGEKNNLSSISWHIFQVKTILWYKN